MNRTITIILLIVTLTAGTALRLIPYEVKQRTPDEIVYTNYANLLVEKGPAVIKEIVRSYNADKAVWIYPPPIRIAYTYMVAALGGVRVSRAASIISLFILALIGIRFFNIWVTAIALLFMAVSPMELTIAQRVWGDGVLGAVGLALIYLMCEISMSPKRAFLYILFAAAGCLAILVKESGVIIFGLCGLWVVYLMVRARLFKECGLFILCSVLFLAIAFLIIAGYSGGISNVVNVMKNNMASVSTNSYAVEYQTGPWYYYLQGFWLLSPAATLFAIIGMVWTALSKSKEGKERLAALAILFFIITFFIIASIPEHLKNLRYISVLYGPFYLMAGIGIFNIIAVIKKKISSLTFNAVSAIFVIALLLSVVNEYRNFDRIFIKSSVGDLVNKTIIKYVR